MRSAMFHRLVGKTPNLMGGRLGQQAPVSVYAGIARPGTLLISHPRMLGSEAHRSMLLSCRTLSTTPPSEGPDGSETATTTPKKKASGIRTGAKRRAVQAIEDVPGTRKFEAEADETSILEDARRKPRKPQKQINQEDIGEHEKMFPGGSVALMDRRFELEGDWSDQAAKSKSRSNLKGKKDTTSQAQVSRQDFRIVDAGKPEQRKGKNSQRQLQNVFEDDRGMDEVEVHARKTSKKGDRNLFNKEERSVGRWRPDADTRAPRQSERGSSNRNVFQDFGKERPGRFRNERDSGTRFDRFREGGRGRFDNQMRRDFNEAKGSQRKFNDATSSFGHDSGDRKVHRRETFGNTNKFSKSRSDRYGDVDELRSKRGFDGGSRNGRRDNLAGEFRDVGDKPRRGDFETQSDRHSATNMSSRMKSPSKVGATTADAIMNAAVTIANTPEQEDTSFSQHAEATNNSTKKSEAGRREGSKSASKDTDAIMEAALTMANTPEEEDISSATDTKGDQKPVRKSRTAAQREKESGDSDDDVLDAEIRRSVEEFNRKQEEKLTRKKEKKKRLIADDNDDDESDLNDEWRPSSASLSALARPASSSKYARRDEQADRERYGDKIELSSLDNEFVYGVHPVQVALQWTNPGVLHGARLIVQEGSDAQNGPEMKVAKSKGVVVEISSKMRMNEAMGASEGFTRPHQGLMLELPKLRYTTIKKDTVIGIPPEAKDTSMLVLALDEVVDPMNLGAILRSAHFFNVFAVLASEKNSAPLSATVAKASAGASIVMAAERRLLGTKNLVASLQAHKNAGWRVIGTSPSPLQSSGGKPVVAPLNLEQHARTIVVMGNEETGMRTLVKEECDLLLHLPRPSKPPKPMASIHDNKASSQNGDAATEEEAKIALNVSAATAALLARLRL